MNQVQFSARGMSITEGMKAHITEKLEKITYIDDALSVSCEVGKTVSHRGSDSDFYIKVLVSYPKAVIRVKKEGNDIYPIMDMIAEALQKKVNQYHDGKRKWEGQENWPKYDLVDEIVDDESIEASKYATYTPAVRKKVISELAPITVSQAIEHLELLGKMFYLFKDIETGKLSVIYKDDAGYTLLIPAE
ncbi:MAG: HPF/RaiA family ribosome-associated protein [Candidatus Dojkabacteria bacterium]|nr:MAG: HPF/RaiA family ribosome-associated protein [Candidatus Dojkabacteria bacterium]